MMSPRDSVHAFLAHCFPGSVLDDGYDLLRVGSWSRAEHLSSLNIDFATAYRRLFGAAPVVLLVSVGFAIGPFVRDAITERNDVWVDHPSIAQYERWFASVAPRDVDVDGFSRAMGWPGVSLAIDPARALLLSGTMTYFGAGVDIEAVLATLRGA